MIQCCGLCVPLHQKNSGEKNVCEYQLYTAQAHVICQNVIIIMSKSESMSECMYY